MKTFILGAPSRLNNYSEESTDKLFSKVGNTGNFAFRYAIKKQLLDSVKEVSWNAGVEKIATSGDIAVLPCANMLGEHIDLGIRYELLVKTNVKPVAVGLGGQSKDFESFPTLPQGTLKFLDLMYERSEGKKNIFVRGEYTKKLLESYGYSENIEALGCPSLFINNNKYLGRKINAKKNKPLKIAVAAGNPAIKKFWDVEKQLYKLACDSSGSYIVQHPLPFLKFARNDLSNINEKWKENIESTIGVNLNDSENTSILPVNVTSFYDVQAWMECLRRHDFVVGARIHGVMLAIQAGVPAMCIVHDSRTQELCEIMKIPYIQIENLVGKKVSKELLIESFYFDYEEFDENRRYLCKKYVDALLSNGVDVSPQLKSLLS